MTPDTFSVELRADDRYTVYSHFGPTRRVKTVDTYADAARLAADLTRRVRIEVRAVANFGSVKAYSVPGVDMPDTTRPTDVKRRAHARAMEIAHTYTEGMK